MDQVVPDDCGKQRRADRQGKGEVRSVTVGAVKLFTERKNVKIDIFPHILPVKYVEAAKKISGGEFYEQAGGRGLSDPLRSRCQIQGHGQVRRSRAGPDARHASHRGGCQGARRRGRAGPDRQRRDGRPCGEVPGQIRVRRCEPADERYRSRAAGSGQGRQRPEVQGRADIHADKRKVHRPGRVLSLV